MTQNMLALVLAYAQAPTSVPVTAPLPDLRVAVEVVKYNRRSR